MSIRARLLWLTLLATALPALLAFARFLQERDQAVEADTARLSLFVQRRAEIVAEKIQGTAQLHFGLSRARDLYTADRPACSAFLAKVREAHPQYTGILTAKPDGSLFCDSLRSGRQLDLRDRAYFQAALRAHDEVILEPVFGRLTNMAVLQVALPVRSDDGELLFILLASLNLQKLLEGTALVPSAMLLLMDNKGVVLARSRPDDPRHEPGSSIAESPLFRFVAAQDGAATREITGPDGEANVWAVARHDILTKAGLRLAAGTSKHVLVQAADRRFAQDLALLGLAAIAVFVAVWLVADMGIRRQVERIMPMARRLAAGDLSARVVPPFPRGELGALMAVMNQTAQALEQQRADIAELNERLRQSQRLEAIGQLTGGVAHDFNNLLTVVMGNAEMLVGERRVDPQTRMLADMILTAAQRGADLTQRLLAFARKQALDPKAVDLNQLVCGMDAMLRRTLGEHIEIEVIRAAGLWQALVDHGQLENALLNLSINARDAMPDGGCLTLETANVRLDAEYADRSVEVLPGLYVMLAVSDTGHGIAPENLPRVFEPFFTTKETGKGTGLGLAMVYGFVKQSAGHVTIYSEPGHGTTVKLYLPRLIGPNVPAEPAEPAEVVDAERGTETVLLVEDDEGVRRYAVHQLRSFGYQVLEAADGASALAIIRERDDVNLLFTDVVMPGGMNGRSLADAARTLRPGLRVLYTSGYTDNAIVHHGRLEPGAMLLTKPYRRSALARSLRAALAAPVVPVAQ